MELLRHSMPAALVPRLAVVDVAADPDLRQGRPGRPAVAAARRPRTRPRTAGCTARWPGSPSSGSRSLGADVRDAGRRLLRPRRRQPHRGAAGLAAARAASPRSRSATSTSTRPSARWPPTSTSWQAAGPASDRERPADAAEDPDRPGGRHHAAARPGRRRAGWSGSGIGSTAAGRRPRAGPCCRSSSWWLLALGWLVFVTPPGRMLLAGGRRPAPAAQRRARRPPARRQGAPAALAGRARGRRARRDRPGRGAVHDVVRPAARRQGRPGRRPAPHPAGDRACSGSARAARSSPRSTSAATGSTATCSTSGRSGSAPGARVGARSMLCPGADVGQGRRGRARARRCSARCPDGEYWSGSPAERIQKRARGPWSDRPRHQPRLDRGVRRASRCCSPACRSRRSWPARPLPVLLADEPTSYVDLLGLLAWLPVSVARRDAGPGLARPRRGPAGRPGRPAGRAPGPQRRRAGGVGDGAGARRGAHLAVPALLLAASRRPGCGCSAPGSARTSRPRPC